MQTRVVLLQEDFASFPIGPMPFDREHSAMGEYHYYPPEGNTGAWYDPITNCNFRGPSWIITGQAGKHFMEQTRLRNPSTNNVCSTLAAGDAAWTDYRVQASMRPLNTHEETGLLFRYQTSLMHYAFFLCDQWVQLWRVDKTERTLLARAPFAYTADAFYRMSVTCAGDLYTCAIDGRQVLQWRDDRFMYGKIALAGYVPAQFTDVSVTMDEATYCRCAEAKADEALRLAEKRRGYAQPRLHKVLDLKNYGAARQIRFGHLMGGAQMYFVIAQHQKRVFKERYCNISCLTAVNLQSGEILWQIGEPSTLVVNQNTTCDLPFQVYDINGDGVDEVIVAYDFQLMVLDGRTGQTIQSIPTPRNEEPADAIAGIEFQKHAFDRLNVDAIRIVNVSGKERPSDILIKDRYARLWVYNDRLELLWKFCHNNTGHFPYAHDFDGDGRDEVFSCYNMIGSDGRLRWSLPIGRDHTDEIIVGRFDPDEKDEMIALVCGWEGFMIVDTQGNIRARDVNGHAQRISAANYCPDRPGFEFCTTTYWENQGIITLYDCRGRELWHREPSSNGNIIAPVNWQGDGTELILLNGNVKYGGMLDGDGDRVVVFPDDGHPDLCAEVLDITGDARDEIVLWDAHRMYIYTQDRPCAAEGGAEYVPDKYPLYNASNYRGEYSFPRWRDRAGKEPGADDM